MEKNYWSLFVCLAMFASAFTLTSCDKDDDKIGSSTDLIGTWKLTVEKGYWIEDGEKESWEYGPELADISKIIFTRSIATVYDNEDVDDYEYTFDGNKLVIDPDYSPEIFKVTKLTSSELIFEYYEKEDNEEYYAQFFFKRVN